MGLFSGIGKAAKRYGRFVERGVTSGVDQITGQAGAEAATEAARIQADELGASRELYRPFIEAGAEQLPFLQDSATAEGYGSNIGDILYSGALDPLMAERQRAATAALSSAGLRRSGAAAVEAAKIPADLSMQIESELNRRRGAISQQGVQGANQYSNISQMIAEALAGGKLGAQQSRAQGTQNILDIGTSLFKGFSGGGI
jgi:hypothetical protein